MSANCFEGFHYITVGDSRNLFVLGFLGLQNDIVQREDTLKLALGIYYRETPNLSIPLGRKSTFQDC
jgi:hypothetical protein